MNRFVISMAAAVFLLLPENAGAADPQCEGHNLLPAPRPDAKLKPE
jgi:hypothetical protein